MLNEKQAPHGHCFVISGPSGVGKTTIVDSLYDFEEKNSLAHIGFATPRSYTTRKRREGKEDEGNYIFVSWDAFMSMIGHDILEYTVSHGNMYGISKNDFENIILQGKTMIKVLDCNGALHLKDKYPDFVTTIFVKPPSMEDLAIRLRNRGTESNESFERRMLDSINDMKKAGEFDFVITNSILDAAVLLTRDIIVSIADGNRYRGFSTQEKDTETDHVDPYPISLS